MEQCKVSVIVATYNPDINKLYQTLDSIISQKGISIEIIVADDGSTNKCEEKLEEYFNRNLFNNFKLLIHEKNLGTVKNILDAVKIAKGQYVKFISPGDYLFREDILSKWIRTIDNTEFDWSFADSVYYKSEKDGNITLVEMNTSPIDVSVYKKKQYDKCRWNYLALADCCLGAATIIRRDVALKYLLRIDGKIKYGEDTIYYLMMYDGALPLYYEQYVIYYEYGEGISTSGNDNWKKVIESEWRTTCRIICAIPTRTKFQQKLSKVCRIRLVSNKYIRFFKSLFIKGIISINIKRRLKCRRTPLQID